MTPTIGTVVIAGRAYHITGIRLHGGQLRITAHGRGPAPAASGQPATVFGDDGQGICQSWACDIPAVSRHQDVQITLPLQFTHLEILT
jgi:hypothetical protein